MRNGKIDYLKRSYSNSYFLYKLKGSKIQWDGINITNQNQRIRPIRAPLGFSIVDDLYKARIPVKETTNMLSDLQLLALDRTDGVAILGLAGEVYLKKYPKKLGKIVKIKKPLITKNYYLMLSHQIVRRNLKLANRIWSKVAQVRDSKEFQKRVAKYYEEK